MKVWNPEYANSSHAFLVGLRFGLPRLTIITEVAGHTKKCVINRTITTYHGEVSEWLKEHAWKACVRETVPRVRIPPSPPRILDPYKFIF